MYFSKFQLKNEPGHEKMCLMRLIPYPCNTILCPKSSGLGVSAFWASLQFRQDDPVFSQNTGNGQKRAESLKSEFSK